jgi:cell division protein ZapA (FtsZ GTPase activity inhibitor)
MYIPDENSRTKYAARTEVKNIKVNISGREYPVNVTPETAAAMKRAAELVNEQAKQFQSAYAITDPRDLLAMCALQLAYQNLEYTEDFSATIENKLDAIESALDIKENT